MSLPQLSWTFRNQMVHNSRTLRSPPSSTEYRDAGGPTSWTDDHLARNNSRRQHSSSLVHRTHSSPNVPPATPYTHPQATVRQPNVARQHEILLAAINATIPNTTSKDKGLRGRNRPKVLHALQKLPNSSFTKPDATQVMGNGLSYGSPPMGRAGQFHENEYFSGFPSGGPAANDVPASRAPQPRDLGILSPPLSPPSYTPALAYSPALAASPGNAYATGAGAAHQSENHGAHLHANHGAQHPYAPAQNAQAWPQTQGYDEAARYSPDRAYPSPSSAASRFSAEPELAAVSGCHSAYNVLPQSSVFDFGGSSGPSEGQYAEGQYSGDGHVGGEPAGGGYGRSEYAGGGYGGNEYAVGGYAVGGYAEGGYAEGGGGYAGGGYVEGGGGYAGGETFGHIGQDGGAGTHFAHTDFAPQPHQPLSHTGLPIPVPTFHGQANGQFFPLQLPSSATPQTTHEEHTFTPSLPYTFNQVHLEERVPEVTWQAPLEPQVNGKFLNLQLPQSAVTQVTHEGHNSVPLPPHTFGQADPQELQAVLQPQAAAGPSTPPSQGPIVQSAGHAHLPATLPGQLGEAYVYCPDCQKKPKPELFKLTPHNLIGHFVSVHYGSFGVSNIRIGDTLYQTKMWCKTLGIFHEEELPQDCLVYCPLENGGNSCSSKTKPENYAKHMQKYHM